MNDDHSSNGHEQKSWLDKIGDFFANDVRDRNHLIDLLRDACNREILDSDTLSMIEGAFQVSEMRVRDVMIPRAQIAAVSKHATPEEMLEIIIESGHSRFPIIGENKDEVVGILLAKDLLRYFQHKAEYFNIKQHLRPAVFIPESKRLNILLKEFRLNRNHMAIVVDEYGGIAGLVTIEDVLEQIVGDIDDEHDIEEEAYILKHDDNKYTIKALTPIEDFNDYFKATLSDEEFDTVGGLIAAKFGHMPERGESVKLEKFHFEVLRADTRRVHLLSMKQLS